MNIFLNFPDGFFTVMPKYNTSTKQNIFVQVSNMFYSIFDV
jgi:hypothetical protein